MKAGPNASVEKPKKFSSRKFEHLIRVSRFRLSATAVRAAIVIVNYTDERRGEICRESIAFLAAAMNVSRETFKRAVRELEDAKLFQIDDTRVGLTNIIRMVEADPSVAPTQLNMMSQVENPRADGDPAQHDEPGPGSTSCAPISVTVGSAGRPSGAGPASDPPVEVADNNSGGSGSGSPSSEDSGRGDAPATAPCGASGAPVASDDEEDWSFLDEVETEDTALSVYRGENNGEMPSKEQLKTFAEERGLPVTDEDLQDVAENEALLVQDEEMVLADLRGGKIRDRFGQLIVLPETDGTTASILRLPRLRAAYVAESCRLAEGRRPSDRAAFWQQRFSGITAALRVEATDAETIQKLSLLNAEFRTELRRREAVTRRQMQGERA